MSAKGVPVCLISKIFVHLTTCGCSPHRRSYPEANGWSICYYQLHPNPDSNSNPYWNFCSGRHLQWQTFAIAGHYHTYVNTIWPTWSTICLWQLTLFYSSIYSVTLFVSNKLLSSKKAAYLLNIWLSTRTLINALKSSGINITGPLIWPSSRIYKQLILACHRNSNSNANHLQDYKPLQSRSLLHCQQLHKRDLILKLLRTVFKDKSWYKLCPIQNHTNNSVTDSYWTTNYHYNAIHPLIFVPIWFPSPTV